VSGAASEPLQTAGYVILIRAVQQNRAVPYDALDVAPYSCLHLAPATTFALIPVYCRKHAAHDSCKTAEQAIRFSQQLG